MSDALPPHTLTTDPTHVEVRFDDPDGSARTVLLIESTPEGVMLRVWNGDALAGSVPDLSLPLEV